MKFSCSKCPQVKNLHFLHYSEPIKLHVKKKDPVDCFCSETLSSVRTFIRHFAEKHKSLHRQFIHVFSYK